MKPIHYIIIAVTTVAAFFFLYKKNYNHKLVEEEQSARSKQVFMGKRVARAIPQKEEDKVFEGCEELESTLSDLDFRLPPQDWITTLELRELDQCEDPKLEGHLMSATEACFGKLSRHNDCVQNLIVLRSLLRTRFEAEANDQENAADLIIREFSGNKPDFKKVAGYAEKLLDIDPSNKTYQKLWAQSYFLSQPDLRNLSPSLVDDIYSRIDPSLLNDVEFQPYRMFLETGLDPMKAEDFSREFVMAYPNRSESYEMLGWSLWQQGRFDEAREQARLALKYNPGDPWLKRLNQDINSSNFKNDTYKGRMHMGMRLEDLIN